MGILSPMYCACNIQKELRFLAHLTGGGKEDVEILLKWLGEPEKNKPQKLDHDLAIKTLKIFSEVWEASKAYKKLNEDLAQQIATVISMKDIRWTPEDLDILKAHETHLKDFPQAQSVSNVISSIEAQMAFLKWAKTVSGFIGGHLLFWTVLIFFYPKNRFVQATFFWNKWIRQWIVGWVYINIALLWIPFLRKKLFEPFADTLLADANIGEFEHEAYFPDSDVVEHAGKRQPIFQAIPGIRGQGRIRLGQIAVSSEIGERFKKRCGVSEGGTMCQRCSGGNSGKTGRHCQRYRISETSDLRRSFGYLH